METVLQWIAEHPEQVHAFIDFLKVVGALDFAAGAIPDKAWKYKGVIRRVLEWALKMLSK